MAMSFEQWLVQVDNAVWSRVGLGRDDLPDCPYRDWYEEEVSPLRAAIRAIRMANGVD